MSAPVLRIALTPGEPAGIGPDLCLMLAGQPVQHELVHVCDPGMLETRARLLGLPCRIREYRADAPPAPGVAGELCVLPVALDAAAEPGQLDKRNARGVLAALDRATAGCMSGEFDALVTGPMHKGIINDAGIAFTGHTEHLARATGTRHVVMMLASDTLRVALVTTHVPLSEVSRLITHERLLRTVRILHSDLERRFGIEHPVILACGLNPHAGEGGHLGREDMDIIAPAISELRDEGIDISGPLPADTLFTRDNIAGCDAVLAMYHDQGLPVLKHDSFGRAVNITLGLPIIRTSVDHGTALELAGTGHIDGGSLQAALQLAVQMASRQGNR